MIVYNELLEELAYEEALLFSVLFHCFKSDETWIETSGRELSPLLGYTYVHYDIKICLSLRKLSSLGFLDFWHNYDAGDYRFHLKREILAEDDCIMLNDTKYKDYKINENILLSYIDKVLNAGGVVKDVDILRILGKRCLNYHEKRRLNSIFKKNGIKKSNDLNILYLIS